MPDLTMKVPAIEKLLDYTATGIGAVAGPMLANWKASREGRAKLTFARADAEVRLIEAASEGQSLVIIAEAQAKARQTIDATTESGRGVVEITRSDITQSIEFQGRKRLANSSSVVESAADELGDKEVTDHEPDPDWTARFFDCVQDVSSEDMQKIWARILAGEVESPGRTSLRTLDTLRNMTQRDADMFKDICDFVILKDFVFHDDSVVIFSAISYDKLLHLQDCGLTNVGPNLVKKLTWSSREELLLSYHASSLMITRNTDANAVLAIPEILLTTAGRELFQLTQCTWNMEYLQVFANFPKVEELPIVLPGRGCPIARWKTTLRQPCFDRAAFRATKRQHLMTTNSKRLIEVAFPLKQVSLDSVHEKNVRHGHISTLHIWPARRPLAASRAALIATLLPDPGDPKQRQAILERMAGRVTEKIERKRVNGRMVEKVKEETLGGILHWGRENGPDLDWFRDEIRDAYGGRAPKVLDPFAGGGAIPLEAMRLGCEVTAMDINPVAWFILKCTLEYPQKLAGQTRPLPGFALEDREFMEEFLKAKGFKGASLRTFIEGLGHGSNGGRQLESLRRDGSATEADLAWHVRAWGRWVLARARRELASYYPTYAEFETLARTEEDDDTPPIRATGFRRRRYRAA